MGGQMTRNALYDSLGGPFPAAAHRCHHKPKRCLPIQCGGMGGGGGGVGGVVGRLTVSPLLFHPNAKGAQIVMDPSQRTVKRQASFCNAITFTNRPIALYEQVRLKITKKQCCWSGALRLGFTCKDPSRISPDSLPKYACPDLVSQSGFWAKALPEEFANEGSVLAFWVDKKGRVFYRVNESGPMLFFSGVRTSEPLWALIDVYGLTRGVQLLDSEPVPPDCLRPRSFTTARSSASLLLRGDADDARLSVSLCDLNLQPDDGAVVGGNGGGGPALLLHPRQGHALRLASGSASSAASSSSSSSCPIPQNSLNSQQSSLLPPALESDLRFHRVRGAHVRALDDQTVARCSAPDPHGGERTLVFTDRPLRAGETVFVRVSRSGPASRPASLSYGVTSCDPAGLRAADLPHSPEALAAAAADRKEFWAVGRSSAPLQSGDILGFLVGPDGEVVLSHNGVGVGGVAPVCVDNKSSRPLWMFYGLHGAVTQLRILGTTPGSPSPALPKSPSVPSGGGGGGQAPWSSEECSICYENAVDTVIYACGHMCLCHACGARLKKMANACCPICRRQIKDIIKTYRST